MVNSSTMKIMDSFLLLLLLVGASAGKSIVNDESCDEMAKALNEKHDRRGYTHFELESGQFLEYTFQGLTVLGLDTFRRTGACTIEEVDPAYLERETWLYTHRLGLQFLQLFFKRLTRPDGRAFSASLSLANSSLRFRRVVCSPPCEDQELWDLQLEEASQLYGRTQITLYSADVQNDNIIINTTWFVTNFNRLLSEERLFAYAVKNKFLTD